jgi:hypothetical protein
MQPETTPQDEIKYPTDNVRYTELERSEIRSRTLYNNACGALMGALAALVLVLTLVAINTDWHKSATPMGESNATNAAPADDTPVDNYDELFKQGNDIPLYRQPTDTTPPIYNAPQYSNGPTDVIPFRAPQIAPNTGTHIRSYAGGCTARDGRYVIDVGGLNPNGFFRVQTDVNPNDSFQTGGTRGWQFNRITTGKADNDGNATFTWSCFTATGMPMSDNAYPVLVTDVTTGSAVLITLTISMNPND